MTKIRKVFIFIKKEMRFLLLVVLLFFGISFVAALPPLPTEFYGVVRYYNFNGSVGDVVQAYDSSGVLCGSFTIVNSGYYGSLTCRADDPETIVDEGFTPGENISFRYRGGFTTVQGDNTGTYGAFKYVNISYPIVFCGDNFCDAWYESYLTCPQDCPPFNGTINGTGNGTNGTGGGGGGGNGTRISAKKAGRPPLGLLPWTYANYTGNYTGEGLGYTCAEAWVCSNWSECRIDGFQNRTCIDKTKCGTFENKPLEVQKCTYTPTCFDKVKNGLEEGIDCGGLCKPCITCFDSIQNCHDGDCEQGVDCGGPCPPCPTCFDGAQNCHDGDCEQGVDCSGPCEKKCPEEQLPIPKFVCKKVFNPLSDQIIFFFIIIILIILISILYSNLKIKKVRNNKELTAIKRAKKILSVKRRLYLFVFIILLIAIILYLYYYFFIMCEVGYRFLWFLLALLFISPLVIHEIIRYLEYTEKKRLTKLENLLNTHYNQIENLLRIENENLMELEQEIANDLYLLMEEPEYKEKEDFEETKILKEIYKELVLLYSKYKEKESPVANEKILCDDIYKLIEDNKYKHILEQDSIFKVIVNRLRILYKQYEEKQKLYDELNKIEDSKKELKDEKVAENTSKK